MLLLLLKAVDRRDTHTMSLFMTPTVIDGYVKKDGTVVAPHVALRQHAPDKHPAVAAHREIQSPAQNPSAKPTVLVLKKEQDSTVSNTTERAMQHGATSSMIEAYNRYAEFRDRLEEEYGATGGYAVATSAEKRRYTRLLNTAIDMAAKGTGGSEDPVFRARWSYIATLRDNAPAPTPAPAPAPAPAEDSWPVAFFGAYGEGSADMLRWVKDEVLTHASSFASFSPAAAEFMRAKDGMSRDEFSAAVLEMAGPALKAAGWPGIGTKAAYDAIFSEVSATWGAAPSAPSVDIAPDEVLQPLGMPNQRNVPDHLLPVVEAIIEKVNRRAKKLGVEGFTLVKGEPFDREAPRRRGDDGPTRYERIIPCTIEGPTIKAPGGWQLAGRVDFEDGSIFVNSRPGKELPKRYRSISPLCEHCKSDRQRNAVFVFSRNDDTEHMQVGRQCLKDYLGHDPAAALWAASEYGGIFDDIDREMEADAGAGGSNRASSLIGLDDVMTAAAWAVREFGFVSRKASENGGGMSPTSADVSAALFGREPREHYLKSVTSDDRAKAAAVVKWVQDEWGSKADTSDYEYNAVELTGRRAVHVRRIGLLTSLVAAYDRAHEEKVAREKRVDAHVGKVGERRDFVATFGGVNSFDTAYGVLWIARFDTPEGMLVYKGSSPFWPSHLKAGDSVKFKATIKEHSDYKGAKQTIISRAVMAKEAAAA